MVGTGKYWYGKVRTIEVGVSTVATGSTTEVPIFSAPFRCQIKKASIVAREAITGAETNNMVLGFKNKGAAGAGTDVVASATFTTGTNASAFVEKDLGAISYGVLPLATSISFYKDENGTGMEMPDLVAKMEIIRI